MSPATSPAIAPTATVFSGKFEKKEDIDSFINQIKYVIPFAESEGIKLQVDAENKVLTSHLMNRALGVVVEVTSKSIYSNFDLATGHEIALLKLSDFTSMFGIFGSKGVSINFIDNEFQVSDLADAESILSFKTADPSLMPAVKSFKGASYFTDITIDDRFEPLVRAMSVLSNEDVVVISGIASKGKVTFKVVNGNMSVNNYKITIDAKVTADFEVPHRKDVFQNMIKLPIASKVLSISERIIKVEATSPSIDMTVYLAKKVK
jgi:hypothetical protein